MIKKKKNITNGQNKPELIIDNNMIEKLKV